MKTMSLYKLVFTLSPIFFFAQERKTDSISKIQEKEIQAINILVKKKLVEQKVDRLVFNIENSTAGQGMSGIEALTNTPLVRVDDRQGISIVGKSSVNVMIDGRMLNLSGGELTNYLQSLRSDDIAKIEVITTPPSKYEAQGNSGLINIILKKNRKQGWSGSLNTSYQRNTRDGFRNGISLNYKNNNFNSTLKLRHYDNGYTPIGNRNLLGGLTEVFSNEKRIDRTLGVGINYSADYEINKKSNIGFIYDYSHSKYRIQSENKSHYYRNNTLDSLLSTNANHLWKTPTHTLSVYYDLKLDSLGKKLNIVGNLLNSQPRKTNDFITENSFTLNDNIVKNTSFLKYNVYSGQADLYLPYSWGTIETGAKYTLFKNNSNVGYYDYSSSLSDYIINPARSNIFDYQEQNYALYASFDKKINNKWSSKLGLRYEYATLLGKNAQGNNVVNNKYGKLFPTAYLSYTPNENHTFSLNYSKRITRPDFQSINPFRWHTNPYYYTSGNSTLQPSFNDNIEFSYTFKNKLTFSVYNQYTQNGYGYIVRFSDDGVYSSIMENSFNQNKLGISTSYYDTFFKIWELYANVNASRGTTKPLVPELQGMSVNSLLYSFYNTIALNESKTFFVMLNFWHSLPFNYGSTYLKQQLEFSPGIKASLFDKQLQISAVLNDAFKTIRNHGYTNYNVYQEDFNQYNDYRRFTFSLTYNFGNSKVKGATKRINFEEQNRAN